MTPREMLLVYVIGTVCVCTAFICFGILLARARFKREDTRIHHESPDWREDAGERLWERLETRYRIVEDITGATGIDSNDADARRERS